MNSYIKRLYKPPKDSHKGQNGKLLVIGGSKQYHGAPLFSILAARRFVDLVYFYPGENDPLLIQTVKRIPDVIVVDTLKHTAEMDCVLFGIGLGEMKFDVDFVLEYARMIVADGDGLRLIKDKVPKGSILTPHEGEFRMLFGMEGTRENVKVMAKKHECVIVKKDPVADIISNGTKLDHLNEVQGSIERSAVQLETNKTHNQGMTKGGTGDVLAGLISAFACKNDPFVAAVAGCYLNGHTGNMLMKKYGYNYCASDLADALAPALKALEK